MITGSESQSGASGEESTLPAETRSEQDDRAHMTQQPTAPIEPGQDRPPTEIEQAIDRLGVRHTTQLRALSAQFHQHANAAGREQAAAPDRTSPFERQLDAPPVAHDHADIEPIEPAATSQPTSMEARQPV